MNCLPSLLYVIECDTIVVLEKKVACSSIKYGVTRWALDFLGHFIAKILDDQLVKVRGEGNRFSSETDLYTHLMGFVQHSKSVSS